MAEALLFQLNPRLKAAAEFVRGGRKFADIGTDHAYLPIWLLKSGICPQAIGADLREGPILRAANNAYRYRVQNRLILRQCDGLSAIESSEADDVAVTGMGGELIVGIIEHTPWLRDPQKHLILQPMTAAEELRRYLCRSGFSILQERAVRDSGRVYTVMLVQYSGTVSEPSPLFCYAGLLQPAASSEAGDYIRQQQRHLRNVQKGYLAKGDDENTVCTAVLLEQLERLLQQ